MVDSEIFLTDFSFFLGLLLKLTKKSNAFMPIRTNKILKKVTIQLNDLVIQRKITSFRILNDVIIRNVIRKGSFCGEVKNNVNF